MRILPLKTRDPAVHRASIGIRLQAFVKNFVLQTPLDLKSTVSASNTSNKKARAARLPSQCLQFSHDISSFSFPARSSGSSRCGNTFLSKFLQMEFIFFIVNVQCLQCFHLIFYTLTNFFTICIKLATQN